MSSIYSLESSIYPLEGTTFIDLAWSWPSSAFKRLPAWQLVGDVPERGMACFFLQTIMNILGTTRSYPFISEFFWSLLSWGVGAYGSDWIGKWPALNWYTPV